MSAPNTDGFTSDRLHTRNNQVESLVPTCSPPRLIRATLTHQGVEQTPGIPDDFVCCLPTYAKKAATIRILFIATHANEPIALQIHQHAA
jgi:hypothetical protein